MAWPRLRPTAKDTAVEEATEEATVEEGTREAITARGRRRPSQAMVAMEEDILEAMEEAMEVVMVVMAVAMEAIAEDTPEEAMVTMAKERPSLDTGHTALMDLMEAAAMVAMVAIALATALDMDLMEVGMAGTPEVADRMAEVTATGDNFPARKTTLQIILIRPKFIFTCSLLLF